MKNRVAVVVGALVMFVSGYILGYTTAIPDFLRASVLEIPEGEGPAIDDIVVDVTDQFGGGPLDNEANLREIQELKKMIVPMLTDEEIKKIREEAAAAAAEDSTKVEGEVIETPPSDQPNVDPPAEGLPTDP